MAVEQDVRTRVVRRSAQVGDDDGMVFGLIADAFDFFFAKCLHAK